MCLPVRTGLQAGPRRHASNPLRIVSVSDSPWESLLESGQPFRLRVHTFVKPGTDLLHSLCRLTC